jgi:uncharacterized protein YdiU (UPF0061 family)
LVSELLVLMANQRADFTNTFRSLSGEAARDQFTDPTTFDAWEATWRARIAEEDAPEALMQSVNPSIIPRNHRVEQMIQAAVAGDMAPFERLMQVLARPYEDQPEAVDLTYPPQPDEVVQATFCGT